MARMPNVVFGVIGGMFAGGALTVGLLFIPGLAAFVTGAPEDLGTAAYGWLLGVGPFITAIGGILGGVLAWKWDKKH